VRFYIKKILKHSTFYGISNFFVSLTSFILIPLYTLRLRPEEYGIYSIIALFGTVIFYVYDLGLISALVRHYFEFDAADIEERKRIVSTTMWFFVIISILFSIFLLWGSTKISSLILGEGKYAALFQLMIAVAYDDRPLPIGFDQTISQPLIIAIMTEALELTGNEKVLEVGTGSGYQAAILAELARVVITTERIPVLVETAKRVLDSLGYTNIEVHLAEETLGWQKEAPYDAIIVTAGAPRVSVDLIAQLAIGGRLVIPVGLRYVQELYKITRRRGKNVIENLGGCRFVSLIGKDAWEEE